jgi:fluoride exporter
MDNHQRDPQDRPRERAVLAAVTAGGVLGALARHGLASAFPHQAPQFPWTILAVNVAGCLLIGVLMGTLAHARAPHPLVQPFLGVGVLGGFTTFSAYALDIQQTLRTGAPGTALAYLAATAACALAAVFAGTGLASALRRARRGQEAERAVR